MRITVLMTLRNLGRIRVRQVEHAHDQIVVLGVRLRVVLRDDDGALVEDLVEVPVRREDLLQRLLDRHAVEPDRHRRVGEELAIELHGDPAHLAERRQHVAQAGIVERDPQRIAVRRIEQRLLGLRTRLLPQRVNRRLRTALLDAIADRSLELGCPATRRGGSSRPSRAPSCTQSGRRPAGPSSRAPVRG